MRTRFPSIGILTIIALLAAAIHAEDFEVRIHRRVSPGVRERESGRVVLKEKVTFFDGVDEEVVTDATIEGAFAIDWNVLEVNKHGSPSKIEGTVVKLHQVGKSADTELLEKGFKFTVHIKHGRRVFKAGDDDVPEDAQRVLNHIVSVCPEDDPEPDPAMEPTKRKKVGESWPLDKAVAVKAFAVVGWKLEEADYAGQIKLEGVKEVRGVRCLALLIDEKCAKVMANPTFLTEGFTKAEMKLKQSHRMVLPVDPKRDAISSVYEEESTATAERADGKMARHQVLKVEKTFEPLK